MRQKMEPGEKPLYWVGASKRDLMAMPAAVIRHIGTALSVAQYGGKRPCIAFRRSRHAECARRRRTWN
jgi:phage-related protein